MANSSLQTVYHGEQMGSTDARQITRAVSYQYGYLKAVASNAGNVYIGGSSDVSLGSGSTDTITTGFEMAAGDVLPLVAPGKLSDLWYITTNAGDEFVYIVFA